MLAANAHLEVGARLPTALDGHLHQLAHSLVEGHEGIVVDNSLLDVLAQARRRRG